MLLKTAIGVVASLAIPANLFAASTSSVSPVVPAPPGCTEKSWCATAPSTKLQSDGTHNRGCKAWVDDCPCSCAGAVEEVIEEQRREEAAAKAQSDFEASWTHQTGGGTKYLLYDVKPGEGFNLQKEIFIRAATAVASLNAGYNSSQDHAEWVLVLPPWCRLAHWKLKQNRHGKVSSKPWSTFFNPEKMNSGSINIIEYDDYRQQFGDSVDISLFAQMERGRSSWHMNDARKPATAIDCQDSTTLGRTPQEHWKPHNETHVSSSYSGRCNNIVVKDVKCFEVKTSGIDSVMPLIGQQGPTFPRSVLMRRFDRYSGPHDERYHAARILLEPSAEVIEIGETFIQNKLPRPFIGAHVRRGDFPNYARKKTTPSLEIAASALKRIAGEMGAKAVFICTDGSEDEKMILRQNLAPVRVEFLDEDLGHPGLNAIVEQWIAARANRFIGTSESRYTLQIQEERDLMGVPPELTWRNFDKHNPDELVKKSNWFINSFTVDEARMGKWGSFWKEGDELNKPKSDL